MNTRHDTALDRMLAARADAPAIALEIIAQARAGLEPFCEIPEGYRHCRLEHVARDLDALTDAEIRDLTENPTGPIVNPVRAHLDAMEFFRMILEGDPCVCENGDPLRPTLGAYLVGPPGAGKTHIMAAFGLLVKERLDRQLARMERTLVRLVEQIYEQTLDGQAEWSRRPLEENNRWVLSAPRAADARMRKMLPPEERFAAAVKELQRRVRAYPYQPTDVLYLGFEELFGELQRDRERRARVFEAIERARIVFIDDVHPKGDPERIRVIQQLIERRYELDRSGTFVTTNLSSEELGGGDRTIAQRLLSRCSESFIQFDFSECADWRMQVKSRRIRLVEKSVRDRLGPPGSRP